jgi:hypothetical protein
MSDVAMLSPAHPAYPPKVHGGCVMGVDTRRLVGDV